MYTGSISFMHASLSGGSKNFVQRKFLLSSVQSWSKMSPELQTIMVNKNTSDNFNIFVFFSKVKGCENCKRMFC